MTPQRARAASEVTGRGSGLRTSFRATEMMRLKRTGVPLRERVRRATENGALRASIFGVNDGIVSNLALIAGVAGASTDPGVIRITGVAGLLAGSLSMAAGEYVSMRVQREVRERALSAESDELARDPAGERRELAAIYQRRGFSPELAQRMADEAMSRPALALAAHARDELGLDPDALGSPAAAATSSFAAFALGAAVPLLPYVWLVGSGALALGVALSLIALAAIGAVSALLADRPTWTGAIRMAVIGAGAAAVTHAIGIVLGVGIS